MSALTQRRFEPQSIGELAETMTGLAAMGDVVTFAGGGTKAGWGNPVRDAAAEIATSGLSRVIDYAPEDLVVSVEAGMTLAALQAVLAAHKQRLAFDPPHADVATIGGLVACGDFGQRRARYGGLRDLIIGVQLVRADGSIVRGGGKVVKNVAGFDLPRIAVGSFGTLGAVASATFRLHPLPETARMVAALGCSFAQVCDAARIVAERQLEPAVLLALREDGAYTLALVFEGFESGVAQQCALAAESLGARGIDAQSVSPDERARIHAAHGRARTAGEVLAQIAVAPGSLETAGRDALVLLTRVLADPVVTVYPSLGIAFIGGGVADTLETAAAIAAAREAVEGCGGTLVLREMPPDVRGAIDPWGTPPPSFFLMERLKANFDPQRRLNRGRFVGGL